MSDLSPTTRALLEACKSAPGLSEAKRAALKSGVLGHVASGTAPLAAVAAVAAGKSTLVIVGVASVLLALGGGGVAWSVYGPARPTTPPAVNGPLASAPAVEPAASLEAAPPLEASPGPETAPAHAAIDGGAPASAPAGRGRPVPAPSAKDEKPRAAVSPATTTTAPAAAATTTTTAATALASPTTPEAHAPAPAEPPPRLASSLEEETRLVRGAAAARKEGDPARALTLLDAHASRFPHGVLERERRAERVFALCDAHRTAEARAEAARLLQDSPRGALADRVRASCGGP